MHDFRVGIAVIFLGALLVLFSGAIAAYRNRAVEGTRRDFGGTASRWRYVLFGLALIAVGIAIAVGFTG